MLLQTPFTTTHLYLSIEWPRMARPAEHIGQVGLNFVSGAVSLRQRSLFEKVGERTSE